MPSQLPWVVAPTIRKQTVSATIDGQECSLEFPVYGALKGRERVHIREHLYQAVVYRESSRLADALVGEGIEETKAQRLAIRVLSTRLGVPLPLDAEEQRILLRHAPLIADIQCVIAEEDERQRVRTVAAVIIHRLPGCQDWTDDDAGNLPLPLQAAIFRFAESEQNANQPARTPDELVDEMVDTLGKLAPESLPPPSTGDTSTGDAGSSGPTHPSSPQTDSETSPSNTSSKRSTKASAG